MDVYSFFFTYYESLCSHHLDESDLIPELLSAFFFLVFFFLGEEASDTIEFVQSKA